ncbi:MAG TPA: hypothetical protein DCQ84_00995 [Candidatus Competibacteraceae bacterium]|nr:hypothetical protein [Candidatus Competibacteraceae bacterium]
MMRKAIQGMADDPSGILTVDLGGWQRFEPDALDRLEQLTDVFKASLQQGREIEPAQVSALLDGIAAAADAVDAARAKLAEALEKGRAP